MSIPAEIQRRLCAYYALDEVPDVDGFIEVRADAGRERVLVREGAGEVELRVELPAAALEPGATLDLVCQAVEGVSHFVLLAERARCELPTTHLELEMQAEVDKFLVLGVLPEPAPALERARLRYRLFADVRFTDEEGTVEGDRYRLASRIAERFVRRLEAEFLGRSRHRELREHLRRFFRAGQTRKLEIAGAF
ncbi:MAG: hypothetical protein FJ096_04020 [Deltaproteobacteria bacterium]|nr:hypothetical protein [Deltaproteobacteria bacterium]